MSPHDNGQQDDRDATNYAAPPPASTDAHDTRYSDPPADPHATAYTPTFSATDNADAGRLPRRFGGYELLAELGHGGMGVVYKARQLSPERMVALKVIRSGELADAENVRRFHQEADEAARLDHPNIVPVYEVGEQGGLHFFTMKLVEGGSLSGRLERYQSDPKAAAKLTATAARAVHYAHQRQLLHRDLKPGNILLDAAGQPHVADFGLAKRMGGAGEASQSHGVGTPEYMAPEQARGDARLTTAADVYALGGVLYALLTGRPPFRGDSSWATIEKVLSEEPAPPSKIRAGVPRDLETICLKCLQKEPARRYGSAEALAEDLERWLRGEPIKGRPVGRAERAWLWCKRNPAAALLSSALVMALVVGATVSTYFAVTSNSNYADARNREKEVGKTNGQLEETLARSLLRPLGHVDGWLHSSEIDAVWELASLPQRQERVRLLFVEFALADSDKSQQLRIRADLAVHAAVGLDLDRRREVEKMLLSRLRDPGVQFSLRTECAYIGLSLEGWGPDFAPCAAHQFLGAMGKGPDQTTEQELADALSSLSGRLEREDADVIASAALKALVEVNPAYLVAATKAAIVLAARQRPKERLAAAWTILKQLDRRNDADALWWSSNGVRKLASQLGAEYQTEAAKIVFKTIQVQTDDLETLGGLVDALKKLETQLKPAEAEEVFPLALETLDRMDVSTLAEISEKLADVAANMAARAQPGEARTAAQGTVARMLAENDLNQLARLASKAATLATWLEPKESAKATGRILEAMRQNRFNSDFTRPKLGWSVRRLAERLERKDFHDLSQQIRQGLGEATDPSALAELAWAARGMATRMEPKEAAEVAQEILKTLPKTEVPRAREELLTAMSALAARLDAKCAAKLAYQTFEVMYDRRGDDRLVELAKATSALGAHMSPEDAVSASQKILTIMRTTNYISERAVAGGIFASLAAKLRPAETGRAAEAIIEAMPKTGDNDGLSQLTKALTALAPHMEPEAAERAIKIVLNAIKLADYDSQANLAKAATALAARLKPKSIPDIVLAFLKAVASAQGIVDSKELAEAGKAFAARLEAEDAAAIGRATLKLIYGDFDPPRAAALVATMAALVERMEPDEANQQACAAASLFLEALATERGSDSLEAITALVGVGRLTEQQLVDLLKMPTCRQPARQIVVRQLGSQCGRPFADQWEFVDWARKYRPDLDLTSPPIRPSPP